MIKIVFKNLESSDLARQAAMERVEAMVAKFPDLDGASIIVNLEMDNSPFQAGRDVFWVKIQVATGRYRGLRLEKSSTNLYVALADLTHCLLEKLNRFGDRTRMRQLRAARRINEESIRRQA